MRLWSVWWDLALQLRPAFGRTRTFLWFAAGLAAACVRPDLAGVTSYVRALGLRRALRPALLMSGGRPVLLADGIKIPKAGRKMPGVKKLHQLRPMAHGLLDLRSTPC